MHLKVSGCRRGAERDFNGRICCRNRIWICCGRSHWVLLLFIVRAREGLQGCGDHMWFNPGFYDRKTSRNKWLRRSSSSSSSRRVIIPCKSERNSFRDSVDVRSLSFCCPWDLFVTAQQRTEGDFGLLYFLILTRGFLGYIPGCRVGLAVRINSSNSCIPFSMDPTSSFDCAGAVGEARAAGTSNDCNLSAADIGFIALMFLLSEETREVRDTLEEIYHQNKQ